jgi:hypothetical protein
MFFTASLEAAIVLATEYTRVKKTLSWMATAADHDPSWSASNEVEYDRQYARANELEQGIAMTLAVLARDHHADWQSFLAEGVTRLDVLVRHSPRSWAVAEYERDQWTNWSKGQLEEADRPEVFARGIDLLGEYRDHIDQRIRKDAVKR